MKKTNCLVALLLLSNGLFINSFAQCPNPIVCSSGTNGDIVNIKLNGVGGLQAFATFTYDNGTSLFKKPYSLDGTFNSYSSTNLNLQTNGTTRMSILSANGNVGIGITSPAEKLDISGNIKMSGKNLYLYGTNAQFKIISNSCSNDLDIILNGCGGFKTAAKITYEGKLICQEIEVKTLASNDIQTGKIVADNINLSIHGVADFVFNENYNLRPIKEVENYITEKNHLPDIPSASELEEKGIDLAKMNNLLLQKIEELTLYIIDQEKRITELENNNK